MQVTYELTEKDFVEAMNAHRYAKGPTQPIPLMVGSVVGGVLLWELMRHRDLISAMFPILLLAVLVFIGFFFLASPRRLGLKQFRSTPCAHGPRSLAVDESGLHWTWDGGATKLGWKNITKFVEGQNQFVFYTSPVLFNPVPKRGLSPDQMSELRAFVQAHLPETSEAFEVLAKGT